MAHDLFVARYATVNAPTKVPSFVVFLGCFSRGDHEDHFRCATITD